MSVRLGAVRRRCEVANHMSLDGVIENTPEGSPNTDWGGWTEAPVGPGFMDEVCGDSSTR